jgi:DNA-binding transcriptional LysR family regulator
MLKVYIYPSSKQKGRTAMNMKQMEYIIAVAEEGGVTEAAKKLYISQPSLSQVIQTVEKEIGVPLFNRRTLPFTLTYAGKRYISMAKTILACKKAFLNEINDITEGTKGQIIIGSSPKKKRQILPYIIPEFVKQFPDVKITLYEDTHINLVEMLLQSKVELAFINSVLPRNKELAYLDLFSEHLVLAVAKSSAVAKRLTEKYLRPKKKAVPLNEVKDERFILLHQNHYSRKAADRMFDEMGIKPNIFLETHDSDLARELAAHNVGITIVAQTNLGARIEPESSSLAYFPIDTQYAVRSFAIAYKKDTYLSKAHRRFIEISQSVLIGNSE